MMMCMGPTGEADPGCRSGRKQRRSRRAAHAGGPKALMVLGREDVVGGGLWSGGKLPGSCCQLGTWLWPPTHCRWCNGDEPRNKCICHLDGLEGSLCDHITEQVGGRERGYGPATVALSACQTGPAARVSHSMVMPCAKQSMPCIPTVEAFCLLPCVHAPPTGLCQSVLRAWRVHARLL